MDDVSLVACLVAAVMVLWWWPSTPLDKPLKSLRSVRVDGAQLLAQLRAELLAAPNPVAALSTFSLDDSDVSSRTRRHLDQMIAMYESHGTVSSVLLDAIVEDDANERDLRRRWSTAVAGAQSSSVVLMVMPAMMWLLAQGLGVSAFAWLFASSLGWACLFFGVSLALLARLSLRRLQRIALRSNRGGSASSPQPRRVLSAAEASNVVFLIALLLRPDVFGISIALAARGAVQRYWRRMPERFQPETASDMSWLCAALSANLAAGLDWLRAVRIVAELEQVALAEELRAVAQRLEWGLDPQDAFLGVAPELEPLAHAIEQTRRSGAPISEVLLSQGNRIRTDLHTSSCERVEKLGASAVVPVAALQLPSFVILGLVPFVATQLGPMLSAFSSTGL